LQKPQHFFILKPTPLAPLEATNSFWALSIKASHFTYKSIFKKELSFATKMIVDSKTSKNIFLTK
jgi:hypothetical protein